MAQNPVNPPMPADLPTNWTYGQTIAPTGAEAGLDEKHGYNYLMQQVNSAQAMINKVGAAIADLTAEDVEALPNTRTINGKALSADVTLTAADVGALSNTEAVPILKGGTGATAATAAVYNLVNALTALTNTGLATGDYLPLLDASANTGKKVTLSNLKTWLQSQNIGARIATGSYTGTGTYGASNPCSLTFDFVPKILVLAEGNGGTCEIRYSTLLWINLLDVTTTYKSFIIGGNTGITAAIKLSGNTVFWCSGNADQQRNKKEEKFYYVAFG